MCPTQQLARRKLPTTPVYEAPLVHSPDVEVFGEAQIYQKCYEDEAGADEEQILEPERLVES